MELAIPQTKRYTVQEYLRLAEESLTKLEYRDGEIIDMAGTTFNHNRICRNFLYSLTARLQGGPCEVVGSDQRVRTADDRYCYPDITAVCGAAQFVRIDAPEMTLTNPTMLIEVLSPSTESTDRGEKMIRYINMPSLREYFLVSQDKPQVQSFYRDDDGRWVVGPVLTDLLAIAEFRSLKVELPLSEIYANVRFEADHPTDKESN